VQDVTCGLGERAEPRILAEAAVRLGHERVGTGHVLLALLEEQEPEGGPLDLHKAAVEQTVLTGPQE
ncbi:Clp protease N-terminal domain-containing protein, partial [Actinoplanes philippinensis]|uniref:Clp protease N-terminal domain-containing protein n=1 Tax=Actinoplanes philippinensis TaxID=35752 RepID=UPI0033E2C0EE